ncbi:MAG: formate dehydrogenase subunit gamma [Acidimicrobiia bacterium]
MADIATAEERARDHDPRLIIRHTFGIRLVHWWTTLTFLYLLLSGFSLGYPRLAWLLDIMGGGQSVRFMHPWIGLGFVVGLGFMLVMWFNTMTIQHVDRHWFRQLGTYIRKGHVDNDTDKFNGGQKGYYWFSVVNGALLLLTGIPLWFPQLLTRELNLIARFTHHGLFLLAAGFLVVHVYLSTAAFPGTFRSMTSGTVERAWAAFHHPRWFRRMDRP